VNSRLYNEKAFVLSRGFVRRALESPPVDLSSELSWLYYKQGKLEKTIHHCKELVEKSRSGVPENDITTKDLAVPWLTEGGIIMLSRTLTKLEALFAAH